MGYHISVNASIKIDMKKAEEIIKLVKEVYALRSHLYHGCKIAKVNTLDGLFTELGYDYGETFEEEGVEIFEMGDYIGEKLGAEMEYWPKIIGLCREGSYIEFDGEEGECWRYRQETNGVEENKCYPEPTHAPKCPCCGTSEIQIMHPSPGKALMTGECIKCLSSWTAEVQWVNLKVIEDGTKKLEVTTKDLNNVLAVLDNPHVDIGDALEQAQGLIKKLMK